MTTSEALPSDEVPPSRGRGCLSAVGWALVAAGALLILAALVLLVIHRAGP